MKPQNDKEIYRGYWLFSLYLAACVLIGVSTYIFYTKTLSVELEHIVDKTEEYDKIYVLQNELSEKIDSLYRYVSMFNTNMNDALLLNSVSKRKREIVAYMENLSSRDVRMYRRLMGEVNTFLALKDSIRLAKEEDDRSRRELKQCIEDNKQMKRKMTIGNITVER
jgi:hypothetical protein